MAKKGKLQQNKKRLRLIEVHKARRDELRTASLDMSKTPEERLEAREKLSLLPRNSAPIRFRNRCAITGRPRGYYRHFNICRIKLREMALSGELAGVTKSSW